MKQHYFWFLLFIYIVVVSYLASTLPISPHEAKMLYASHDVTASLMQWGEQHIGGFFGLRLFSFLFGFLSIGLFYQVSRLYLKKEEDIFLATTIFMWLPGLLTAAIQANSAILVIVLVLFFILVYEKGYFVLSLPLMLGLFFVHEASIIFFIALLIYGVVHKDKKLAIITASFLITFVYLAKGISIGGRPSGHFAEIFGLYATVFSPLVFLYFFYAMYRILLREEKTLLWYISFTALVFSLLLSIRQRVYITDFGPYVMIAVVLMIEVFNKSIRVRLPQFQRKYRWGFYTVIAVLIFNTLLIVFHKPIFALMDDPKKHFAYRIYKPYWLMQELRQKGQSCFDTHDERLRYQLRYYGVPSCQK
ncbi:MAG: hypothetical protein IE885_09085 [Campylobacterales bacterium]|nr:hypothetical protein [Campylobacterales bacterium]